MPTPVAAARRWSAPLARPSGWRRRAARTVAALALALAMLAVGGPDAAAAWTWPVRGEVVAGYSYRGDPYRAGQHRGIDVAAPAGAPVVAAAAGTVRYAGVAGSSGLTVSVRTADGRFDTSYLHLSEATVGAGQAVAAGQRIGAAGASGDPSTAAAHLHFGVRLAGTDHAYRDPLALLPPQLLREPPRGVPVAVRAPVRVAPRPLPAPRLGPAPVRRPLPAFANAPVAGPAAGGRPGLPALGPAIACAALALAICACASSIGPSCRTTSRRRSTTSTASRISATSTRPSPPTCSPGTCASAATTSSS